MERTASDRNDYLRAWRFFFPYEGVESLGAGTVVGSDKVFSFSFSTSFSTSGSGCGGVMSSSERGCCCCCCLYGDGNGDEDGDGDAREERDEVDGKADVAGEREGELSE